MPDWFITLLMAAAVAFGAASEIPDTPRPMPVEETEAHGQTGPGMEHPTDQEIAEMMNLLEMMELLKDVDLLKDFDALMEEN